MVEQKAQLRFMWDKSANEIERSFQEELDKLTLETTNVFITSNRGTFPLSFFLRLVEKMFGCVYLHTIAMSAFDTDLGKEHIDELCKMMVLNQSVTTLYLPYLSDAKSLATHISENTLPLKEISCVHWGIGSSSYDSVLAIIRSLATNTTITNFDVSAGPVYDLISIEICNVLDVNPYLTSVTSFGRDIDDPFFTLGDDTRQKIVRNRERNYTGTLFGLLIGILNEEGESTP